MSRLIVAMAAAALIAAAPAPAAYAHAARVATDPAENAVLSTAPTRVSATFNERLQTIFAAMTVVGPDGKLWSAGDPKVQGAIVSVGLRPLGPAGNYTVNYRVTSHDGHVVSGAWSFRLIVPGTGSPGPGAVDNAGRRIPVWPFGAAALALLAAVGVWAARRRP